jgi:UTP--glucose-1-phosphate uridylyltransferase
MARPVTTAVILAAGLGTRMLPATKAVPKEMLPVVDRPLIDYCVDEAMAAGITTIVFVIAEGKESILEHFRAGARVETALRETGNQALADSLAAIAAKATFHAVYQPRQLGIAHAVACAREFIEGRPFALLFPDDVILGERSCTAQLVEAYGATGGSVIAVEPVADVDVPQYGIVDPVDDENPARLRRVVEKPRLEEAPSRLGIVGRYVLSESILQHIDETPPGRNGERQITDAIARQIAAGEPVSALQFEGRRYDTGQPLGYIVANVAAAMGRPALAGPLRERLSPFFGEGRPCGS